VVIVSALNYGTGFRAPLETLGPLLKSRGILLYVDGTQGCGALQYDMGAIQPAAFAVDAYKWMLTPNGAGFLYVDPQLRPHIAPSVAGWRSDRNWRQVNNLNHGDPVFSEDAERYEGGQLVFPSLYAMGAVLDLMLEIGPAAIEARALELADRIRALLLAGGALNVNEDRSPIVTAAFAEDAGELALKLKDRGVIVSARHGRLRVSPHFYNNEEDLESLSSALID
jgi:selenocysteine lyase/cysteine desulfurase